MGTKSLDTQMTARVSSAVVPIKPTFSGMSFVCPQNFTRVSLYLIRHPRPCSRVVRLPPSAVNESYFVQHPPHFSPPLVCMTLCLTIPASPKGAVLLPIASTRQSYDAVARTHRSGLPFSRKVNFASPSHSWGRLISSQPCQSLAKDHLTC